MLDPLRAMSRPNSEFLLRGTFRKDSPYSCGFTAEIRATSLQIPESGPDSQSCARPPLCTAPKMLLLPPPDLLQVLCLLL
jgi:hypothetical protein